MIQDKKVYTNISCYASKAMHGIVTISIDSSNSILLVMMTNSPTLEKNLNAKNPVEKLEYKLTNSILLLWIWNMFAFLFSGWVVLSIGV